MSKLGFDFTFENIEKLADIVNDKELSEISLEGDDGVKLTIKGKKSVPAMPVPMIASAPAQSAPSVDSTLAASEASMAEEVSGKIVKSPIVGTFYSSPSPDKPPFVKTGDEVKKGDVIMIIESMKLMNEIQSEYDGVVEQILVSDGQAVEFDQPIMVIK